MLARQFGNATRSLFIPSPGQRSRPGALPGESVLPLRGRFNVDTIKPTAITFDPAKNEANIRERGLPFSLVKEAFDWASAQVIEDTRRNYGERLHAVVYTPRGTEMHVISLRKANRREVRRHGEKAESGAD